MTKMWVTICRKFECNFCKRIYFQPSWKSDCEVTIALAFSHNGINFLYCSGAARTHQSHDVWFPDTSLRLTHDGPCHLPSEFNRCRRSIDTLLVYFQDVSRRGYKNNDVFVEEVPSWDFRCLQVESWRMAKGGREAFNLHFISSTATIISSGNTLVSRFTGISLHLSSCKCFIARKKSISPISTTRWGLTTTCRSFGD